MPPFDVPDGYAVLYKQPMLDSILVIFTNKDSYKLSFLILEVWLNKLNFNSADVSHILATVQNFYCCEIDVINKTSKILPHLKAKEFLTKEGYLE